MQKKELSFAFSIASRDELQKLAQTIVDRYEVYSLAETRQTLVMVQVREHVRQSRFYLGEVLCTQAQMEVAGRKGCSVLMGSDKAKAEAAAVLDAAFNAGLPEISEIAGKLQQIVALEQKERQERTEQAKRSQVDFSLMA